MFNGRFGDDYLRNYRSADRWSKATGAFFAAGIVSTVVSAVLWSKSSTDFLLEPSAYGLQMSYRSQF